MYATIWKNDGLSKCHPINSSSEMDSTHYGPMDAACDTSNTPCWNMLKLLMLLHPRVLPVLHGRRVWQGHPCTMAPTAKDNCIRSYCSTILGVHMGNLFFCNSSDSETNLAQLSERDSQLRLRWGAIKFMSTTACCGWVSKCDLPVAIQPLSFKIPISKYSWEVFSVQLSTFKIQRWPTWICFPWINLTRLLTVCYRPTRFEQMNEARKKLTKRASWMPFVPTCCKMFFVSLLIGEGPLRNVCIEVFDLRDRSRSSFRKLLKLHVAPTRKRQQMESYYYSSQICLKHLETNSLRTQSAISGTGKAKDRWRKAQKMEGRCLKAKHCSLRQDGIEKHCRC